MYQKEIMIYLLKRRHCGKSFTDSNSTQTNSFVFHITDFIHVNNYFVCLFTFLSTFREILLSSSGEILKNENFTPVIEKQTKKKLNCKLFT